MALEEKCQYTIHKNEKVSVHLYLILYQHSVPFSCTYWTYIELCNRTALSRAQKQKGRCSNMASGCAENAESLLSSRNSEHIINTSGYLRHQTAHCNWRPFSCFVKVPTWHMMSDLNSDLPCARVSQAATTLLLLVDVKEKRSTCVAVF